MCILSCDISAIVTDSIKATYLHTVSYCIKHPKDTGYHIMVRNQLFPLAKVKSTVDLGVRFDNNVTFRDHISEKN